MTGRGCGRERGGRRGQDDDVGAMPKRVAQFRATQVCSLFQRA